ncbi:hypothetical protein [Helicobacter sp. MIT 05-5294]|nr:hypothetical protein [Helicobacter sp. MIT 05-5294]
MKKIFFSLSLIAVALTFNACSTKKVDRQSPCACYEIEKTQDPRG